MTNPETTHPHVPGQLCNRGRCQLEFQSSALAQRLHSPAYFGGWASLVKFVKGV